MKNRFKSNNDLQKATYYFSPSKINTVVKLGKDTSKNLNLNGEQMTIKDNIMKVVNIESVVNNLEEKHLLNDVSSRLLFR